MIFTNYKFYIVIIVILIILLFLIVFIFLSFVYFSYYEYSSGVWIDTNGNFIIINNNGIIEKSKIVFSILKDDNEYDTTESSDTFYINPFFPVLFHKFSAYYGSLVLRYDMVSGTLEIKEKNNNIEYGTFYKNALSSVKQS